MQRESTIDNMSELLQEVGTLRKDQLLLFFSDTGLMNHELEFLLSQLVYKHNIKYDEDTFTYSFVGGAKYIKEIREQFIRAFWVVVWMGSKQLGTILIPRYPTQFLIIQTENDEMFDITIVDSKHDALMAQRVRSEYIIDDEPDIVKHIAILRRKSDVKMLRGCGFDSFCIIDPVTYNVTHYKLGEG